MTIMDTSILAEYYINISNLHEAERTNRSNEFTNCLERLLLSTVIDAGGKICKIPDGVIYDKFKQELKEKHIRLDSKRFLRKLHKCIPTKSSSIVDNSRPGENCWIIDIKTDRHAVSFNVHMSSDRFEFITKRIHDPRDITDMILRYSSILAAGQHWALPQMQFMHLVYKYDIAWEGFASPLNTGLFEWGGNYCSLFPEDVVFGSSGSFFEQDMVGVEGKNWIINPPFIETIIDLSCEKILQALDRAIINEIEMRIVFILPTWSDMKAYTTIHNSRYCKHVTLLDRGKHFYEHMGVRKVVKSKSSVFVLDTFNDTIKYDDIAKYMRV